MIDVSDQNKYLKSYAGGEIVKSKILGIIRKNDRQEYKVYEKGPGGFHYLFSGSPEHFLYAKYKDENYDWVSLADLSTSLLQYSVLSEKPSGVASQPIFVRPSDKLIPVVDVKMENGCYFSEGVLSHNSGGNALKFYASIRLDIRRKAQIKKGEDILGNLTEIKVVKNKVAPPYKVAETEIRYGEGVPRALDILLCGMNCGVVSKRGAWLDFNGECIGQGKDNAWEALKNNPELLAQLEKAVRTHYGI